ncbi:TetR family transcriptional regulator [Solirubrobacter sp. CPCC 204708]|uniref:TetR family transcriptional regulator n=1 Tax=Solirubrobacter deserti TaxID=2282478 RepID=A0ABT4RIQ5_9ACTN|nr:TetR family transcriptional regulator [Solirubrobacter deserti]MBE2320789.1 TetR family transcriptional regulator [Solirubrobacter deserti]MDA0138424.1 TetR family transcriptional regulator [Solirubrobacter deserti]
MTEPDGRRARGEARRHQLIEATLAVIERDGLAGLTHRAVAEQAGVPLASASYHFRGIDELAATALNQVTDDLVAALRAEGDRSLGRLAQLLADEVRDHRGQWIACYELYLLAIRRPQLRDQAFAWLDVIADTFAPTLTGTDRQAFQALVEGICLHTLLRDRPYTAAEIEALLRTPGV